jgi:uncharacterized Zn finger protein
VPSEIATILHRDTLAALVGELTFERGEKCFLEGNVVEVVAGRGELRGVVRAREPSQLHHNVRLWVRADGIAYQCSCGARQLFCMHTIAIALAHLAREHTKVPLPTTPPPLRSRLTALEPSVLVDRLLECANTDPVLTATLKRICDSK